MYTELGSNSELPAVLSNNSSDEEVIPLVPQDSQEKTVNSELWDRRWQVDQLIKQKEIELTKLKLEFSRLDKHFGITH